MDGETGLHQIVSVAAVIGHHLLAPRWLPIPAPLAGPPIFLSSASPTQHFSLLPSSSKLPSYHFFNTGLDPRMGGDTPEAVIRSLGNGTLSEGELLRKEILEVFRGERNGKTGAMKWPWMLQGKVRLAVGAKSLLAKAAPSSVIILDGWIFFCPGKREIASQHLEI